MAHWKSGKRSDFVVLDVCVQSLRRGAVGRAIWEAALPVGLFPAQVDSQGIVITTKKACIACGRDYGAVRSTPLPRRGCMIRCLERCQRLVRLEDKSQRNQDTDRARRGRSETSTRWLPLTAMLNICSNPSSPFSASHSGLSQERRKAVTAILKSSSAMALSPTGRTRRASRRRYRCV
jgi:hypothetical protein